MLTALAGLVAALLAATLLSCRWRIVAGLGTAALAAAAGLAALAALATGGQRALTLPIGLPGAGMTLALDPLAAFFLLPVAVAAVASGLCAGRASPWLPLFAASMLFTVLAGDPAALVLGFAAMGAAGFAMAAGAGFAAMAVSGPVCLLAALALLPPEPGFDAMRATHRQTDGAPPPCWR